MARRILPWVLLLVAGLLHWAGSRWMAGEAVRALTFLAATASGLTALSRLLRQRHGRPVR